MQLSRSISPPGYEQNKLVVVRPRARSHSPHIIQSLIEDGNRVERRSLSDRSLHSEIGRRASSPSSFGSNFLQVPNNSQFFFPVDGGVRCSAALIDLAASTPAILLNEDLSGSSEYIYESVHGTSPHSSPTQQPSSPRLSPSSLSPSDYDYDTLLPLSPNHLFLPLHCSPTVSPNSSPHCSPVGSPRGSSQGSPRGSPRGSPMGSPQGFPGAVLLDHTPF